MGLAINKKQKVAGSSNIDFQMQIPTNINYVYWNEPNELVQRLRLLIASTQAGSNSHSNEIASIVEELRESNIIV